MILPMSLNIGILNDFLMVAMKTVNLVFVAVLLVSVLPVATASGDHGSHSGPFSQVEHSNVSDYKVAAVSLLLLITIAFWSFNQNRSIPENPSPNS
jgi:heme/copper-type cytochrome/quinol oxidase subunit 2